MPVLRRSTLEKKNSKADQLKQVSHELLNMDHESVVSSVSKVEVNSKCSNSSKRAKAALQLAELRQRQIEIDNEFRLASAKNTVEMAKLQLTIAEDSEEEAETSGEASDKKRIIQNYLDDCKLQEVCKVDDSKCDVLPRLPMAKIDLPKVELQQFDGNPADYWMFIRQFDAYIHDRISDAGQRLMYLMYYCKGKAKESIKGCVMLNPDMGYPKARCILKERFGQPHRIARALIDGVLGGVKMNLNTAEELDDLATRMQNCEIALCQMNYTSDLNAASTLERIVSRLPLNLQEQWASRADSIMQTGMEPSFSDLAIFIVERARVCGSRYGQLVRNSENKLCRTSRSQIVSKPPDRPYFASAGSFVIKNAHMPSNKCSLCSLSHELESCDKFLNLDVASRWDYLRHNGRCFICMEDTHNAAGCKRKKPCGLRGCKGRHHNLLHATRESNEMPKTINCTTNTTSDGYIQLGMVPIKIKGPLGEMQALAFLDNGSDTTLVKSTVLKRLGIEGEPAELTLTTVNCTTTLMSKKCQLQVISSDGEVVITIDEAYSVSQLPVRSTRLKPNDIADKWPHLRNVPFVDSLEADVELLIGCDIPEAHWVIEQRIGERKQPFATRTPLGWLLHGPANSTSVNCIANDRDMLRLDWNKLYNQEFGDVGEYQRGLSMEELKAVESVNAGTKLVEGQYEVPLPWRAVQLPLPDSRVMAARRLEQLKKRLLRDSRLHDRYRQQMEDHIQRGYAVKMNEEGNDREKYPYWYIPHHVVLNPKKPEKVRIVFDCAAKWGGLSLNDCLYSGPDNTSDLCGILMGFRLEATAVAADIEEMFLRVKLTEKDRNALRFLWWEDSHAMSKPVDYRLTVHPFGATSSPFCANHALRQAVKSLNLEGIIHKQDIASTCFYVDDLITSFKNAEQAITFSRSLTETLQGCGFKLRKWLSNDNSVVEAVSGIEHRHQSITLSEGGSACHKALGIKWNTKLDQLHFEFSPRLEQVNRRGILSCVSSLFDPLGLVCPLLLPAKLLLQSLCKSGHGWDDPLSAEDMREWTLWTDSMQRVKQLEFDRCIKSGCGAQMQELTQLHIFCDASEKGYGTVAYGRYHTETGIKCSLIWGKARVNPTKAVSIPRLELSAAVLSIRAFQLISKSLPHEFEEVYFWTDSTIVLYYIRNTTDRFNTFVANRLTIIHEWSKPTQWKHVNGANNPADKASRGCYVTDESLKLWFDGPEFLRMSSDHWPVQPQGLQQPEGVEVKVTKTCAKISRESWDFTHMFGRYSVWFKLLRAVVWWLRYKDYLSVMSGVRSDGRLMTGQIRMKEIDKAGIAIVILVQKQCMYTEFELLNEEREVGSKSHKRLSKKSPLRRLCPIMRDGMICVGGRLNYSNLDVEEKHPAILPSSHHVTDLIISHYHLLEGHCGTAHLLTALRRKYWIPKGRNNVRRVIGKCVECKRRMASMGQQMMAPLPPVRVTPGWRAFNIVGIDYFGPLLIKKGRSMEKRYGCLFTCLQMRAVHIEIAHDLSTDSFLMALMRFIGRRGAPTEVYSDNGTTFVGAESEIKRHLANFSQNRINDELLQHNVQWHFNPPLASHRGGVWERMIRSVRQILNALVKEQTLNDEMLMTFVVEAERIINSRPIVAVTEDPTDESVLTPNDLLLLHKGASYLSTNCLQLQYIKRWKRVNYLASLFWTRWTNEYLPTLQSRQKWLRPHRNFKVGDVVLVTSEPRQRDRWPLAIVTSCETDDDGLVRTVSVRMNGRELRRDIRKVVLLEGAE